MEYVTNTFQNFQFHYHWQKCMTMESFLNYYIAEVYFKTSHDFVFGLFLVEQNTS